MPRLKFDLTPIDRNLGGHRDRQEHEAFVVDLWDRWKRPGEPGPCDCGFYGDDWLVMCDEQERRRCRSGVEKRLEKHHRMRHLESLAEKRKFPQQPPTKGGTCRWCRQPIVHGRVGQRTSHDGRKDEPDCRQQYNLHTDLDAQRRHLVRRDGIGCFDCGAVAGRWTTVWVCPEHRVEEYGFDGPNTQIIWQTHHEVDHFIALSVAFVCFPDPDRRRWFFGPRNLRLLCTACHKTKTNRDRALLREIAAQGPEHGKAVVLDMLQTAGLLKVKPL